MKYSGGFLVYSKWFPSCFRFAKSQSPPIVSECVPKKFRGYFREPPDNIFGGP